MLNDVRRWQQDHERARRHLLQLQGLRRGHVTVGLMECLADSFAPRVLGEIQTQHPRITIAALVGSTEHIASELAGGRLDAAVAFNMPDRPEVKKAWSAAVPIGFVMSSGHPLARRKSIRLSDCVPYPLVLPDRSLSIRALIDAALSKTAIETWPVLTSNSIDLIKATVRAGDRLSLLSRIDVYREIADGSFVFHALAGGTIRPEILSLCTPARHTASRTTALVVDAFRAALTDLIGTR